MGPAYSQYFYQWTVSTLPENSTEAAIQTTFMNSAPDKTVITFPNKTFLMGYAYTFQATIYNDDGFPGTARSIDIQVTDCLPPDFNLTGIFDFSIPNL